MFSLIINFPHRVIEAHNIKNKMALAVEVRTSSFPVLSGKQPPTFALLQLLKEFVSGCSLQLGWINERPPARPS